MDGNLISDSKIMKVLLITNLDAKNQRHSFKLTHRSSAHNAELIRGGQEGNHYSWGWIIGEN